jgi:hypothetical protein
MSGLDRVLSMDIEWVLYHLIHDDPDFTTLSLDVDFYDDDVWGRLLASLSHNSTVENVKVERYQGGEGARTYQELGDLFWALAQIPSIETLTIGAVSSDDFMAARPLLRHKNLRICHLDWTGVETAIVPEELGVALSAAPKLENLVLEDPSHVNCELWLLPILRSSSLKILKVETYSGARLHPEGGIIFESLQTNSTLREFSLGYLLDDETAPFVAEMIRRNTVLETVRLTLVASQEEHYHGILDALVQNQTLSLFENVTASAVGVSVEMQQKQQEMLQKNEQLEFLSLFRENPVFLQTKTMYLKLNAAGRKTLFNRDSSGKELSRPMDWLHVMTGTSDNLDCLYYCIAMNPSLCKAIDGGESSHVGKRKR